METSRNKSVRSPLIGVTGPDAGGLAMWYWTRLSVWIAGGRVVRITCTSPLVEKIDGLILGGGSDVDSSIYGEDRVELSEGTRSFFSISGLISKLIALIIGLCRWLLRSSKSPVVDLQRDKLERDLLVSALKQNLPILGICRGAQIMNVHLGGNLYQALAGLYQETKELRTVFPRKEIEVLPNTLLFQITGRNRLYVNSLHRQGVKYLAPKLRISAQDKNNIVQAIESEAVDFCIGVQWHPEFMPYVKEQLDIFKALIVQAKKGMGNIKTAKARR